MSKQSTSFRRSSFLRSFPLLLCIIPSPEKFKMNAMSLRGQEHNFSAFFHDHLVMNLVLDTK
jgi:hypothetical protein